MDDISIFGIGVIVVVLFLVGVFHTVKEFQEMYSGEEQEVPRNKKMEVDR